MNLEDIKQTIKSYSGNENFKFENIYKVLDYFQSNNLYRKFYNIQTAGTEPEVIIDGKKLLMFSSNNYLGLSTNKDIILSAQQYLAKHGLGPGGSRFLCGNLDVLTELDQKISKFLNTEDTLTFPTGYMANVAIVKSLMDALINVFPYRNGTGLVFSDEFNHGSIVDGCKLSKAKKIVFKHNDLNDLEKKLSKFSKKRHKMIITEGVYSLEGEITPLPEIINIAKKYNAIMMVDDAHGIGVLGKTGAGTKEHFGITDGIDILMGSFDKALGGLGGFLTGNKKIIDYLRITANSYILSSALPAVIAGGMIKAIEICTTQPNLRTQLFENYNYVSESLKQLGFTIIGNGELPVAPVIIGDEQKALLFSKELFNQGVYIPPFRWPAVPKNKSRMRITLMSTHKKDHLDKLIDSFHNVGKKLSLIN